MEPVWELQEGQEAFGSLRGGLGKESVHYEFTLERPGYYYLVASLPPALNERGNRTFNKFRLQHSSLMKRLSDASKTRYSVDVRITILADAGHTIFGDFFTLDMGKGGQIEHFVCFEVPGLTTPAKATLELTGNTFAKRLFVAAACFKHGGGVPQTEEESKAVARMGKYLLTRSLKMGSKDYDQVMKKEKAALVQDIPDFGVFGGSGAPEQIFRSISGHSTASPPSARNLIRRSTSRGSSDPGPGAGPVMFEITSDSTIGDAMFYLVDKGIQSAPVWDDQAEEYLGLFDIEDAMNFTLKLRDMQKMRARGGGGGHALNVHGVEVGLSQTSSWYGLDLKVEVFFQEENRRLAKFSPLQVWTPMDKVLSALGRDHKRIPVLDPQTHRIVKVISQSEIIKQVFKRFIQPKTEPRKKAYFESVDLNFMAADRGIKVFSLEDSILNAFERIMTSNIVDAVPVVDESGKLVASISSVDSWFLCKLEMDENEPLDPRKLSIGDFLDHSRQMLCQEHAKERKMAVPVTLETPLKESISKIVQHKVHGVYVCDDDGRPLGRVNVQDIVLALVKDDVGIFKLGENVASVFLWKKGAPGPARPTVSEAVRSAAVRSAARRGAARRSPTSAGSGAAPGTPPSPAGGEQHQHASHERSGNVEPADGAGQVGAESSSTRLGRAVVDKALLQRFVKPNRDSVLDVARQVELEKFLPNKLQGARWYSVYLMRRDGASSLGLLSKLRSHLGPLVFALRDSNGHIFGGFLPSGVFTEPDANDVNYLEGPLGDYESFVFTFGKGTVPRVSGWTRKNRFFRLLSASRGFGMGGGGGGFAFFVDRDLKQGSSSSSATYDNPCLASQPRFTCINLEVFAISTSLRPGPPI